MGILDRILGPKSKYDRSLPYSYEARIRLFDDGGEHQSYLSDTICGLIEHLHRRGVRPLQVEIFEIFRDRETPIEARLFADTAGEWLFRPELCRAFERHYPGHIQEASCSFSDRGRDCLGP